MLVRNLTRVLIVSIVLALGANIWAYTVQTKRSAERLFAPTTVQAPIAPVADTAAPVATTPMVTAAATPTTSDAVAINHAVLADFERNLRIRRTAERVERAVERLAVACEKAAARVEQPQTKVDPAPAPQAVADRPNRNYVRVVYSPEAPATTDDTPIVTINGIESDSVPETPMVTAHVSNGSTIAVTPSRVITSSAHGQTAWLVDTMAPIESASVSAQDGQVTVGYAGGATRTFDDSGEELGGVI